MKYRLAIRVRAAQHPPDAAGKDLAKESNFSTSNLKIKLALKLTQEQYQTASLTLDKMARQLNISISHFARLFKQETGFSFKRYLKIVRMRKAEDLLLSSVLSIKEIAVAVGYNHVSDFDHHFKDTFNINPSDYRRKIQGSPAPKQEYPMNSKNTQNKVIDSG